MSAWPLKYVMAVGVDVQRAMECMRAFERGFGLLTPDEARLFAPGEDAFLSGGIGPRHLWVNGNIPQSTLAWLGRN